MSERKQKTESGVWEVEAGIDGEDQLQGGIAGSLERLRGRLLDPGDRNCRLNLPPSGSRGAPRQLGFVEANLERVLTRLRNEEELGIRAVPYPNRDRMISFDEFTNNPETYLDGEEKRELVVGTVSRTRLWAEEYARQLGIDTSYELEGGGSSGVAVERGRGDDELQVLHYADELERVLIPIRETGRVAEREMGLSTLHLVIGLLEWYETPNDESPRLAPLVLVPVALLKRRAEGQDDVSPYIIEWSGEEIGVNQALRIMIRQRFGLNLPEIGDDESFGSYLGRLGTLMAALPRWQVRHRLTLTNLDFHQLRIWEDLDPVKWPGNRLLGHPLVRDLLLGRQVDAIERSTPSIDDLDEAGALPPLIHDADSSQQLAIVEGLRGESLVIEGGPGTGKTQTVANLIAATLWQGRSVLLVAEGRTALEAVRARLAEAGLGDFCLCLGRQGFEDERLGDGAGFISRTRELAVNLRERMERRGSREMPAALPQKRSIRASYRQRLADYESMIHRHYGACGRTIAETIGIRESLYQSLASAIESSEVLALIEGLRLDRVESLTLAQVEAMEENAGICAQSLIYLRREGELTDHPWFGLKQESLDPDEEQVILDILQSLVEVTEGIGETLRHFAGGRDLALAEYERSICRLMELEPLLPTPGPGLRRDLLSGLASPESRDGLRTLGRWLAEQERLEGDLACHFSQVPELESEDLDRLRAACRRATELGFGGLTIDQLRQKAGWMAVVSNYVARSATLFEQVTSSLECDLSFDLTSIRVVIRALILLNELPVKALPSRVPGLEREGIGPVLTRARQEAEQLRTLAESLARRVDRRLSPSLEELSRYAVAAANAGPFSFVSRDYRAARRGWLGMVKQDEIRTARQMANDFRDLLNYQIRWREFTSRGEYTQILGSLFKGLETPFTDYDQLVKWYDRIRLIIGQGSEPARRVARSLMTQSAAALKGLIQFKEGESRDQVDDFISFYNRFESLEPGIPSVIRSKGIDDLNRLVGGLREMVEVCQSIGDTFADLRIETASPLGEVGKSLEGLRRRNELRGWIESRLDLARSIRLEPVETAAGFSSVEETITFVEQLESTALPIDYRLWLCDADIDRRLDQMRETMGRLRGLYQDYISIRERFRAVTGIDETEWYGVEVQSVEISFGEIRRRAERALAAQDELPAWLTARRAQQMMAGQGLAGLSDLVARGEIPLEVLVDAVRFVYHNSILAVAFRQFPRLAELNGMVLDETRRRFAAVDREVIDLNRQEIAAQLDTQHIPPGNRLGPAGSYTELGLISHLAGNRNARIGIREVIRRSAGALVALKPCFMMSPHSVASYLPPESIRFDMVILDEASQMRPEDALGAIARGGQLVVVGDRFHLPPGQVLGSDAASGELKVEDPDQPESILDIASLSYHPVRKLKWHYCSGQEGLISFSNHEFYHDRLSIFPTPPGDRPVAEVELRPVEGAILIRGANRAEAEQVVAAAIDHLLNRPQESLGIVGLSQPQRELLVELLERGLRDNPVAAKRYQQWRNRGQEVLIRSLATIQGAERDTMIISGTAGPDPQGHFRLATCGQLNDIRHGHRWLNVTITRPRRRLICFSSIHSTEIRPGPNTAWGVRAWRDLLALLEAGSKASDPLADPRGDAGEELASRSRFESVVAASLRARGLRVMPRMGNVDGVIELAVGHPRQSNRCLLVIECDQPAGQAGGSISDRHRLRPEILQQRGWHLHHVWATDWLRSREQEIDRIIARVASLAT